MTTNSFEKNVFVNCPFDNDYITMLRPLLFTLLYLGYNPRIATERSDSGEPRITKITQLIKESRFGIHDLSRIQAKEKGEFFRFNMPFELGMDYGCKSYGSGVLKNKKCLILETEPYRYQAAISDISNSDIEAHYNDPIRVVRHVRNWLVQEGSCSKNGATEIWYAFNDFMAANYNYLTEKGFSDEDIESIPVTELFEYMTQWIKENIP